MHSAVHRRRLDHRSRAHARDDVRMVSQVLIILPISPCMRRSHDRSPPVVPPYRPYGMSGGVRAQSPTNHPVCPSTEAAKGLSSYANLGIYVCAPRTAGVSTRVADRATGSAGKLLTQAPVERCWRSDRRTDQYAVHLGAASTPAARCRRGARARRPWCGRLMSYVGGGDSAPVRGRSRRGGVGAGVAPWRGRAIQLWSAADGVRPVPALAARGHREADPVRVAGSGRRGRADHVGCQRGFHDRPGV
jgi:hypothetical protein